MKYEDCKVRRVIPTKKWYVHVKEPFDYDKQEEDEKNIEETGKPVFPNDICFVSGTPLYDKVCCLKIGKKTESGYDNISNIFVHRFLIANRFSKGECFRDYFNKKTGYTVITISLVNYPRSSYDVVSKVPNTKINPKKKEIMECVCKYGSFTANGYLCTVNIEKNIIYAGCSGITAIELLNKPNPSVVLFHCYGDW